MEKRAENVNLPRWAPFSLIFLGCFLFASPATFGYSEAPLALNDRLCGIFLAFLGSFLRRPKTWTLWIIGLLGIWLQFAPLVFKPPSAAGYLNDTFIGILSIFFSIILCSRKEKKGKDIPKGWSYNPSAFSQRAPVIILTGLCWFLARYLAAYQLHFIDSIWDPVFGEGTVRVITSTISKALPIPDAGLGAFAYTLEFLLGCHGGKARWRTDPWLVLSFGLLVVPVGLVSIFLIMMQPLVVHSWCTICLITAFAMLFMILLTVDEVAASLQFLKRGYKMGIPLGKLLLGATGEDMVESYTPPGNSPIRSLRNIFSEIFLGCNLRPNLIGISLCGLILTILPGYLGFVGPLKDSDYILGPLTIVVSIIAMAKVTQKIHFILYIFAIATATVSCIFSKNSILIFHISISVLIFILCLCQLPKKKSRSDLFRN